MDCLQNSTNGISIILGNSGTNSSNVDTSIPPRGNNDNLIELPTSTGSQQSGNTFVVDLFFWGMVLLIFFVVLYFSYTFINILRDDCVPSEIIMEAPQPNIYEYHHNTYTAPPSDDFNALF